MDDTRHLELPSLSRITACPWLLAASMPQKVLTGRKSIFTKGFTSMVETSIKLENSWEFLGSARPRPRPQPRPAPARSRQCAYPARPIRREVSYPPTFAENIRGLRPRRLPTSPRFAARILENRPFLLLYGRELGEKAPGATSSLYPLDSAAVVDDTVWVRTYTCIHVHVVMVCTLRIWHE